MRLLWRILRGVNSSYIMNWNFIVSLIFQSYLPLKPAFFMIFGFESKDKKKRNCRKREKKGIAFHMQHSLISSWHAFLLKLKNTLITLINYINWFFSILLIKTANLWRYLPCPCHNAWAQIFLFYTRQTSICHWPLVRLHSPWSLYRFQLAARELNREGLERKTVITFSSCQSCVQLLRNLSLLPHLCSCLV